MSKERECSIRSPTRIDLSGGLLDIWPVHALVPDCFVVNCSIPVFTSVELKCHSHGSGNSAPSKMDIKIQSPSGVYEKSFPGLQDVMRESACELDLLNTYLQYWKQFLQKNNSFKGVNINDLSSVTLKSESPVGAGLGGSSSLCVSLAKAFCSLFKQGFTQNELLRLCRDLETTLLHAPAGIQDYIPAMELPDFLFIIECSPLGPKWKKKKIPFEFFKHHLLLVDTGKSHHSGNNNWEILKKIIERDQDTLNGIYQLRDNALKTVELCEKENWPDLSFSLNQEQELRGSYFSNWLNPSVSSLINLMSERGAEAMKFCGAGGGGCLIVLAKNRSRKQKLEQICHKNNVPVLMSW